MDARDLSSSKQGHSRRHSSGICAARLTLATIQLRHSQPRSACTAYSLGIFAGILKQLTELVVEDSVKMQRKAMASLGELLFFIASQEEVCFS